MLDKRNYPLQVEKKMSTVSNPEIFLSPNDLTTPAASVAASSIAGSQAQTLQLPSEDSSKSFKVQRHQLLFYFWVIKARFLKLSNQKLSFHSCHLTVVFDLKYHFLNS